MVDGVGAPMPESRLTLSRPFSSDTSRMCVTSASTKIPLLYSRVRRHHWRSINYDGLSSFRSRHYVCICSSNSTTPAERDERCSLIQRHGCYFCTLNASCVSHWVCCFWWRQWFDNRHCNYKPIWSPRTKQSGAPHGGQTFQHDVAIA